MRRCPDFRRVASVALTLALLAAGTPSTCEGAARAEGKRVRPSARVERLLASMTLAEKIGQLTLATSDWDVTGPSIQAGYKKGIETGAVGSIFNAYTAAFTRQLQTLAVEKTRLKIPLLFGYDVVHGHRTIFPMPLAEAASWDLGAIERSARIAATEAAAEGLHWTFAPMVDIGRDPRWGRVAEGAGEDPHLGSAIAAARVRGFQGKTPGATDAVLACAKHFAAYGAAQAGRDYHTVDMSPVQLESVYLPPFKAAVDAGVASFMTAFNDLNGVPMTGHKGLITDVLRGRWGFDGFVVTDYTSINEMVPHGYAADERDAARLALLAGVDMDMQGGTFSAHGVDLVTRGAVPLARIDEAVRQVLRAKESLGLLDDPYRFCDARREKEVAARPEHRDAARDMARRSIVLLRNEGDLLPLADDGMSIALIGPLAADRPNLLGSWKAAGDTTGAMDVLAAFKARSRTPIRIEHQKGCDLLGDDRSGFSAALALARRSSVIVAVMGEPADYSGEAASRTHLDLPGVQSALLHQLVATGKPVVLVVMSGRPLALAWEAQHCRALVQAWYLGTMAGPALADVLFGDVSPSGRLPITVPRTVGQVPIFHAARNTGRPVDPAKPGDKYKSRYLDVPNSPLFPFGFGLTYTRIQYGVPRVNRPTVRRGETVEISVDVANVGSRAADEVVQLYLGDPVASLTRPVRELKGFQRITLGAGSKKTVTFSLREADLAFCHTDLSWSAEAGAFIVTVGPDSERGASVRFQLVD